MSDEVDAIVWFEEVGSNDLPRVGGKNASLGEMICRLRGAGVRVPPGFATTTGAYWRYIEKNGLRAPISAALTALKAGRSCLAETGATIRTAILSGSFPPAIAQAVEDSYRELCRRSGRVRVDVAVRSSATAEDLPDASFAGQQESYLNVRGETALLDACRRCYASLFTDRAIAYREARGVDHLKVALSIGVQRMVRSDLAGAGVMFTLDPETGFDRLVVINAAFGLGESVVQGTVDPDEYQVFKPLLSRPLVRPIIGKKRGEKTRKVVYATDCGRSTRPVETLDVERAAFVLGDDEILELARWGCAIEDYFGRAMDTEWAKDGETGEIFVVQARPETVHSPRKVDHLQTFRMTAKGRKLISGLGIGEAIVAGPVCLIDTPEEIERFVDGAVLVTRTTDPNWVPIMRRAAAIVTDHGGRTSHAAIISRELGLPAIVGTGDATRILQGQQEVTVSCAEGDEGFVYEGRAEYAVESVDLAAIPATRTKVMLNLADPAAAFRWWRIPSDGVGLARMEFVISNDIQIHPMALVDYVSVKDDETRRKIDVLTKGCQNKTEYFVDRLSHGLARIAAAHFPHPVIVRTSDFKSNEYADLVGGLALEPREENPMLGLRGASRYYSPRYQPGFALECQALRRLREEMGFDNVIVMIPFCRTIREADRVLAVMAENGLRRGQGGLEIYVMCEIPSNVIRASAFAERFDGFSIGSNDLTQLTLGVDRDAGELADLFDEQDEAVKWMIAHIIRVAHQSGRKVGLCGEAPSNRPQFAEFLVGCGIDSVSVSPDSFVAVKQHIARAEAGTSRPL